MGNGTRRVSRLVRLRDLSGDVLDEVPCANDGADRMPIRFCQQIIEGRIVGKCRWLPRRHRQGHLVWRIRYRGFGDLTRRGHLVGELGFNAWRVDPFHTAEQPSKLSAEQYDGD